MTTTTALRFLSEEYFAEFQRLTMAKQPAIPQANVRLQFHAIGTPEGALDFHYLIEKGIIVRAARGRIEADLTITATYPDLIAFHSGELHAATAFVTGQFAVTGDKAKLLELMLVLQSGPYHQLNADLWGRTTC